MKLLFPLFLSGCFGSLQRAQFIVWSEVYRENCAMPKVTWEVPSTCAGGWEEAGKCLNGQMTAEQIIFIVNTQPLHTTALAHELLHAAIVCRGQEDGDPDHARKEWRTLLPVANRKLEASGY